MLLIDRGSNINAADYDENTPLHIAVIKNNIEIVEILLDNGANSNAVNDNGSTPLHFAVSRTFQEAYGLPYMIMLLIDRGSNINAVDIHGDTLYTRQYILGYGNILASY